MEYLFLLPLILAIFICVMVIWKKNKQLKEFQKQEKEKAEFINKEYQTQIDNKKRELEQTNKETLQRISELDQMRETAMARVEDTIRHEKALVIATVENLKRFEMEKASQEIAKKKEEDLADLRENHERVLSRMLEEERETESLLASLRDELLEYRNKRAAINESILRERAVQMEKDFHRIILSDDIKEDISYLLSIEPKIHNKEILRKLIWTTYIQPAANEMMKRVLNNEDCPGIYKITDSQGMIYIGKSTKVKSRWVEHIKSSLQIGTISHQEIHTAFIKRGWDDFTFELLEKCDKDDLSAREKYYINFYESAKVGYNMKLGG